MIIFQKFFYVWLICKSDIFVSMFYTNFTFFFSPFKKIFFFSSQSFNSWEKNVFSIPREVHECPLSSNSGKNNIVVKCLSSDKKWKGPYLMMIEGKIIVFHFWKYIIYFIKRKGIYWKKISMWRELLLVCGWSLTG